MKITDTRSGTSRKNREEPSFYVRTENRVNINESSLFLVFLQDYERYF